MDILGWILDQLMGSFGLKPLRRIFASGDYQSLLTVDGFGHSIGPIIPLLLVCELVRGIVLHRVKREDYQVPLLTMVLNNFIGTFLTITMVDFCIGLFIRFAPFQPLFSQPSRNNRMRLEGIPVYRFRFDRRSACHQPP